MKSLLIAILSLSSFSVIAQNTGKTTDLSAQIPMKSGSAVYDTTVETSDDLSRDMLDENSKYYFQRVFGSELVKESGSHKMTGYGTYSFSIDKTNNPESVYTVNYLLDIAVKNGKYSVVMHDFTIEHLDAEVNIGKRLDLARKNEETSKKLLSFFQYKNQETLRKVHQTMQKKETNTLTASR